MIQQLIFNIVDFKDNALKEDFTGLYNRNPKKYSAQMIYDLIKPEYVTILNNMEYVSYATIQYNNNKYEFILNLKNGESLLIGTFPDAAIRILEQYSLLSQSVTVSNMHDYDDINYRHIFYMTQDDFGEPPVEYGGKYPYDFYFVTPNGTFSLYISCCSLCANPYEAYMTFSVQIYIKHNNDCSISKDISDITLGNLKPLPVNNNDVFSVCSYIVKEQI